MSRDEFHDAVHKACAFPYHNSDFYKVMDEFDRLKAEVERLEQIVKQLLSQSQGNNE